MKVVKVEDLAKIFKKFNLKEDEVNDLVNSVAIEILDDNKASRTAEFYKNECASILNDVRATELSAREYSQTITDIDKRMRDYVENRLDREYHSLMNRIYSLENWKDRVTGNDC
jgi:hypothetical protein